MKKRVDQLKPGDMAQVLFQADMSMPATSERCTVHSMTPVGLPPIEYWVVAFSRIGGEIKEMVLRGGDFVEVECGAPNTTGLAKLFDEMCVAAKDAETRMGTPAMPGSITHKMYRFAAEGNHLIKGAINELKPNQQHADELEALVRAALMKVDCNQAMGNWIENARAVIAKISPPEPPTAANALAMLEDILNSTLVERRRAAKARALIDHARATGVIK